MQSERKKDIGECNIRCEENGVNEKDKKNNKKSNIGKTFCKKRCGWRLLRLVGILLGGVCFLWFLAPLTVAGILNIGNLTGMVLSLLLVGYAAFTPRIHSWIRKLWEKRRARITMTIAGCLVMVCAILVVIESACMIGACVRSHTPASTAIVLGCRVYGERASLSLVERLEAAYDYLVENPEANCVVSGGQGPGENISEAECMYRWLVAKGIEPTRIYKEDKSTSTDENIAFSKKVIEENGLVQKITIITSEYHTYRAGMIADDNGLVWGAAPGKTAIWLFPTYYVRELYAILAEWIF